VLGSVVASAATPDTGDPPGPDVSKAHAVTTTIVAHASRRHCITTGALRHRLTVRGNPTKMGAMSSSGDRSTRVLRFAVSTALLGAGAAALVGCQKPRVDTGPTDAPPTTDPLDGAPVAETAPADPSTETGTAPTDDTTDAPGPTAPERVNPGPQPEPQPPAKPPTPTKPPTVMVNPGPAPK